MRPHWIEKCLVQLGASLLEILQNVMNFAVLGNFFSDVRAEH